MLYSYNYVNVPCIRTKLLFVCFLEDFVFTITAFEDMHPHLEARGKSFPAASRPNHRFPPSSLDGSCCDGSRSACGYACPCLAPFALHERRCVLVFASTFFVFPRFFFFFSVYVFQMIFLDFCSGGSKRAKFDQPFLVGHLLDSSADCFAVSAQSQPRGRHPYLPYSIISTSPLLSKRRI